MEKTLVLLAAGLASRYGGNKQVDGVGPHGEWLMQYAIFDAMRAGFTRVVFIIRPEMEENMRRLCGDALGRRISVRYAYQTPPALPDHCQALQNRAKPFGTVHALWCAKPHLETPFAVLNADDYYGPSAFVQMADLLDDLPAQGEAGMIGYLLKNTLSDNGTVTRGICRQQAGLLTGITETYHIGRDRDGVARDLQTPGAAALSDDDLVSMNIWGFTPWIFNPLEAQLNAFFSGLTAQDETKEYQLPTLVGDLIGQNLLRVHVRPTHEAWFGMTYREDRPLVAQNLALLHEKGVYPPSLLEP